MRSIFWEKLELVVFDVDGTLYDQRKLRRKMLLVLVRYYIVRPWKYKELLILYHFRKEREKRAGYRGVNLEDEQYLWILSKVKAPLDKIKSVVNKWIFNLPNKYLMECIYPGLKQFLKETEERNILTAVYSDYDSEQKLKSLNIVVDMVVSSTDAHINAFKPLPQGLNYILTELKIKNRDNCLFIGDRMELDGKCADLAAIPFVLVNKNESGFYHSLSSLLKKACNQIN